MDASQYQEEVLRTEPCDEHYRKVCMLFGAPSDIVLTPDIRKRVRLLHCVLGMSGEVGELADAFKKSVFYQEELDETHLIEEIGDSDWYKSIGLSALGSTIGESFERNIAKLRARFPGKFNCQDATVRDREAEREALEKS